ncbi:MAG TPA: NHL repeat-containing protein [Pirellulales bacterium]|nr:NHL repeat-containing protein [Pirellulales bacterium]
MLAWWLCWGLSPIAAKAGLLVASDSPSAGFGDVLAYDALGNPQGSYLAGTAGALGTPLGITFGSDGNLYIADAGNAEVWRFNPVSGALAPFVAPGAGGLISPDGLAFDTSGNLYVADRGGGQVLEYDGAGNLLSGGPFIPVGAGGLVSPTGLTFDSRGNLFVADAAGGQVLKYDSFGHLLNGGPLIANGTSGLKSPTALAFDNGNLYIANVVAGVGNSAVLEYDAVGNITTVAAGLTDPTALALDNGGHLFVSDAGNGQVFEAPAAGGFPSVFIDSGAGGLGTPQALAFYQPPFEPVPEPTSFLMLAMAATATAVRQWRRQPLI